VHGRLPHTYGCESKCYTCGTLFIDHVSGKVFNYCQFSTNAYETIQSKHPLEALARQEGFDIKAYHSDNGTFTSAEFKANCERQQQEQSFSGVCAHHQNGVAEGNIGTVAQWARANLPYLACHWPTHASVRLWPFAIAYAVCVFNRLLSLPTGICPNKIWSESCFAYEDFGRAYVFGCPMYVLEPRLQDGKKITKWAHLHSWECSFASCPFTHPWSLLSSSCTLERSVPSTMASLLTS